MGFEIFDRCFCGYFPESGTYANPTGTTLQRFGYVQSNNVNEETNQQAIRYAGGGTRDVHAHVPGPLDVDGTVTFYPQDWKSLFFVLGSVADAGSPSPYSHTIIGVNSNDTNPFTSGTNNPMVSFTLEDTHETTTNGQHFKRTINGCIAESLTISANQGEIISCELGYVGQSITMGSGASSTLESRSTRPFLWQDVTLYMPSGTGIEPTKTFTFSLNNTFVREHYLNGSRTISSPIATARVMEASVVVNANSANTKTFFDSYFLGPNSADGSEFNMLLSINASTGSRDCYLTLSGCKLKKMSSPTQFTSDIQQQTLTIEPKSITAVVNDEIFKYGAW